MRESRGFLPTKHFCPFWLRQFGHVRVGIPVEAVHTVRILHVTHREGHGGEDTRITGLLKKVTKVHGVYFLSLGVVPVYTGRGVDASTQNRGNF